MFFLVSGGFALDTTFDLYGSVDWETVARRQALNDMFSGKGFMPLSPASIFFRGPREGQFRLMRYALYLKHYCLASVFIRTKVGSLPKPVSQFGLTAVRLC